MKTLGLIGGTSWHSTIEYYRHLNSLVEEKLGAPPKNPPLLLYSLNVDLMRRGVVGEINDSYLAIANTLQEAGAEALMICANTPHMVVPFVEPKIDIPLIHIGEGVGKAANEMGIKKLGLLGTLPTMEMDFMKKYLKEHYKLKIKVPEMKGRVQIHRLIATELTRGIFTETTKAVFLEEMNQLKEQGVEGIIMGCTEIPMLIKEEDFDLPLLDTTFLHAQLGAEFILS